MKISHFPASSRSSSTARPHGLLSRRRLLPGFLLFLQHWKTTTQSPEFKMFKISGGLHFWAGRFARRSNDVVRWDLMSWFWDVMWFQIKPSSVLSWSGVCSHDRSVLYFLWSIIDEDLFPSQVRVGECFDRCQVCTTVERCNNEESEGPTVAFMGEPSLQSFTG